MAQEIAKTFVVRAAPDAVWGFLTDLPRVASCLPGASIGEKLDERTYTGTMTIKVGPVSSTYRGKVVFERLDPAAHSAEIVATGQDVRGKGGADLRLTSSLKPLPGGATEVTAVSLVNVTGLLAQMGRGMIQDVSNEIFQIFSERMRAGLETPVAPSSPAAARPATPGPPPSGEVALDAVALGTRAARRTAGRWARQPTVWALVLLALTIILSLFLFRRSS
jgi:carbon monoxide dehydrogenase subunit G